MDKEAREWEQTTEILARFLATERNPHEAAARTAPPAGWSLPQKTGASANSPRRWRAISKCTSKDNLRTGMSGPEATPQALIKARWR